MSARGWTDKRLPELVRPARKPKANFADSRKRRDYGLAVMRGTYVFVIGGSLAIVAAFYVFVIRPDMATRGVPTAPAATTVSPTSASATTTGTSPAPATTPAAPAPVPSASRTPAEDQYGPVTTAVPVPRRPAVHLTKFERWASAATSTASRAGSDGSLTARLKAARHRLAVEQRDIRLLGRHRPHGALERKVKTLAARALRAGEARDKAMIVQLKAQASANRYAARSRRSAASAAKDRASLTPLLSR